MDDAAFWCVWLPRLLRLGVLHWVAPVVGDFEEGGRRKRIRVTKKTDVRKRFGVDPWEQPIPKRWKAVTLRGVTLHGCEEGMIRSELGLSHVGEPWGIG